MYRRTSSACFYNETFRCGSALLNDLDTAQILTQHFGHYDGAVGTLVLLYDSREDTGSCQTGAVEGVNEVDLTVGTAVADITPASLIVTGI